MTKDKLENHLSHRRRCHRDLRCLSEEIATNSETSHSGVSKKDRGIRFTLSRGLIMEKSKKRRLMKKGWVVGDTQQFLGLTDEEMVYIELKLGFSKRLREKRVKEQLTQAQLAKQIKSSQSRVAKMEAGDPSVSIDLLIRSLIALGASKKELAGVITASNLV